MSGRPFHNFENRVCEEWNRLDGDMVPVGSVNAFKRKLDHHLRNVRGYFQALSDLLLEAWMDPGESWSLIVIEFSVIKI